MWYRVKVWEFYGNTAIGKRAKVLSSMVIGNRAKGWSSIVLGNMVRVLGLYTFIVDWKVTSTPRLHL